MDTRGMDEREKKQLVAHMSEAGRMQEAVEGRQKKINDFLAWLKENTRGIVWSTDDRIDDPLATTYEFFYVMIEGRYRLGEQGAVGVQQGLTLHLLDDPTYRKVKTTEMVNALAKEMFGPFG